MSGTRQECSHRSSLQLDSHRCSLWFNVVFEMNTIYDTAKHNQILSFFLSFFKWLTLMWIKALFYMNVSEGPQDVCGWRKCCTTCSSLEFEHWWRVNPPVFLFLFFSSWTVILCPMNEKQLVGLFSSSCAGIILFVRSFLYFSFASIGQIVFMIWWNISTWKCETAEPQAVWMFVSFFVVH